MAIEKRCVMCGKTFEHNHCNYRDRTNRINELLAMLQRVIDESKEIDDERVEMDQIVLCDIEEVLSDRVYVDKEAKKAHNYGAWNQYADGLEMNADNTIMTFDTEVEANEYVERCNKEDIEGWKSQGYETKHGPCYQVKPLNEKGEML